MRPEELNECFVDVMARRCRHIDGAIVDRGGGLLASLSHSRPSSSYCIFTEPAASDEEFETRVAAAIRQGTRTTAHWHLAILTNWMTASRAGDALHANGFRRVASAYGLWSAALATPRRELPRLDVRRARDVEQLAPLITLNNRAYGVEPSSASGVYLHYVLTPGSCAMIGYVDGEAVTCAAAVPMAQGCYLGAVATDERWRGRGYGEAICRHTLACAMSEMRASRAILLASASRVAHYESLGFRVGAEWQLFRVGE